MKSMNFHETAKAGNVSEVRAVRSRPVLFRPGSSVTRRCRGLTVKPGG
jgi:hypothetical protein